jgi:signal peptidase I
VNEYAGYTFLVGFLLVIGSLGAARLFAKSNQPWVAAFIPVWNVIVVLKMVGRPVSHLAFFLVPFFNVYFFFRLCIELAQSFGKYSIIDYILVSVFNVFYILNLALAYNEEYQGPVYGVDRSHHSESSVLTAH